jgi:hypothetical protein
MQTVQTLVFQRYYLVLSRITSRVQHDLRRILIKERKPFKKKYMCVTKSRKLACTTNCGVVAIGIAKYDSLNRVATTATGVIALPAMAVGTIARLELKNAATKYLENG